MYGKLRRHARLTVLGSFTEARSDNNLADAFRLIPTTGARPLGGGTLGVVFPAQQTAGPP